MAIGRTILPIGGGGSVTNIIPNRVIPDFSSVIDFTGDIGWQWDNGTYNYNDGSGIVQELDPTAGTEYWFRLKNDNQFGNKFRFTDDMGVSGSLGRYDFQSTTTVPNSTGATPGYFIDHLTGLGWTTFAVAATKNYTDSLALCASASIGIYNDFRMPSLVEFRSLAFIDSLIYTTNTGDLPFARGGLNSFDPTGTSVITTLWYNRAHGSATRGGTVSNFRLRSSDAPIANTTALGTYGVRKHF